MKWLSIVVLFFSMGVFASNNIDISRVMEDENYSENFKSSLLVVVKQSPNFDYDNYLVTFGCGGGAICFSIYDSKNDSVLNFLDTFIIDDFHIDYSETSSKFFISGRSGYDDKLYIEQCYKFQNKKIINCD